MKAKIHTLKSAWRSSVSCAIAVALLLALVTLTVLATQTHGGPFDGSSLAATHAEADVGDQVGFAIYLVNSDTTTASNVLAWNPLPAGATFVAASGGAFPIVGDLDTNAPFSGSIPDGLAYDVQQEQAIPLRDLDLDTVTGVAWLGDIPPGGLVTPGLIVQVERPAGRYLADAATLYHDRQPILELSGKVWIRPYTVYEPLTLKNWKASPPEPTPTDTPTLTPTPTGTPTPSPTPVPTSFVTITLAPAESIVVAATGPTREGALAAVEGLGGWTNDGEFLVHNQHDRWVDSETGQVREFWSLERQYFRFDLLPDSTPLELHLPVTFSMLQPPTGTLQIAAYPGTWIGPLDINMDVWTGWQPATLGEISFTLPVTYSLPFTMVVPLDLSSPSTATLKLVIRAGCEDHPEICSPETDWFMHALSGLAPALRVRVRVRVPEEQ